MRGRPFVTERKVPCGYKCVAPEAGLCEIGHPGCLFGISTEDIDDIMRRRATDCIKAKEELKYFIVVR